jgi:Fic family protein
MNEKFVFNVSNIKKIYHILTKDLLMNSWDKYPRWFKKVENTVNEDITSSPENVEKDLENLISWYKNNKNIIFPLELAYLFHLKFEKIHPFIDWNWRIWRFLINKILIDNNYFPIILFSDNKKSFFNSIKNPWINNKKYLKTMLEQHKKTLDVFVK